MFCTKTSFVKDNFRFRYFLFGDRRLQTIISSTVKLVKKERKKDLNEFKVFSKVTVINSHMHMSSSFT